MMLVWDRTMNAMLTEQIFPAIREKLFFLGDVDGVPKVERVFDKERIIANALNQPGDFCFSISGQSILLTKQADFLADLELNFAEVEFAAQMDLLRRAGRLQACLRGTSNQYETEKYRESNHHFESIIHAKVLSIAFFVIYLNDTI